MLAKVSIAHIVSRSCIADIFADYKKLKGMDVVGTLISLFETKDVFVKEFQAILGTRLLKNDLELDKEVSLHCKEASTSDS